MPVYVDIPTEYGKTWLKDLVTGNASICLELDQELKTDNHKAVSYTHLTLPTT